MRSGDELAAVVTPDGAGNGSCVVSVEHRAFTGSDGSHWSEQLYLVVSGEALTAQLCQMATALAATAVTIGAARSCPGDHVTV
jgi:hypothetical protein